MNLDVKFKKFVTLKLCGALNGYVNIKLAMELFGWSVVNDLQL
jgi:hypothetical protein